MPGPAGVCQVCQVHHHLEQQAALLEAGPGRHVWCCRERVVKALEQRKVDVHVGGQHHLKNKLAHLREADMHSSSGGSTQSGERRPPALLCLLRLLHLLHPLPRACRSAVLTVSYSACGKAAKMLSSGSSSARRKASDACIISFTLRSLYASACASRLRMRNALFTPGWPRSCTADARMTEKRSSLLRPGAAP